MPVVLKSKLPRLPSECYRGCAIVHWTHSVEGRETGWLDERFHRRFRETLLHAGARWNLACAAYVVMPDHWHLVWVGLNKASDQKRATALLRKTLEPAMDGARLQDRAHDHVCRGGERRPAAVQNACSYVWENPGRSGYVADWRTWPYVGAMIVGYPRLDPRDPDFWPDFWRIYNRLTEKDE